MHDRGVKFARELDQFGVRAGAAGAPRIVTFSDPLRTFANTAISSSAGHTVGRGWRNALAAVAPASPHGDVSRQGDHRDAPRRKGGLHGDFQHARHLLGLRHQLAVMAALGEEMFRMGFLKISAADFMLGIWAAMASTGTRLRWQS